MNRLTGKVIVKSIEENTIVVKGELLFYMVIDMYHHVENILTFKQNKINKLRGR